LFPSELALSLVRELLVLSRHLEIGISQLATFLRAPWIGLRFRFAPVPPKAILLPFFARLRN